MPSATVHHDWVDYVTSFGTAGAALAAAYAAVGAARSTKASQQLVAIERERRDDERLRATRAEMTAAYVGTNTLRIENGGPAIARQVQLEILDEGGIVWAAATRPEAVPDVLHPRQVYELQYRWVGLRGRRPPGLLRWTDGTGPQQWPIPPAIVKDD